MKVGTFLCVSLESYVHLFTGENFKITVRLKPLRKREHTESKLRMGWWVNKTRHVFEFISQSFFSINPQYQSSFVNYPYSWLIINTSILKVTFVTTNVEKRQK